VQKIKQKKDAKLHEMLPAEQLNNEARSEAGRNVDRMGQMLWSWGKVAKMHRGKLSEKFRDRPNAQLDLQQRLIL